MKGIFEQIGRPGIKCPRCKNKHLTIDVFCEHCLYSFLDTNADLGWNMFGEWDASVRK